MSKIKVEITASETITYKQIVEMAQDDYEQVKDLSSDDVEQWVRNGGNKTLSHNPVYAILENYLDRHDVFDSEDEFTDVSIEPVSDK